MKAADIARSSNGRIAELQTALSELAASQVAMTEDGIEGGDRAQQSLDGSR